MGADTPAAPTPPLRPRAGPFWPVEQVFLRPERWPSVGELLDVEPETWHMSTPGLFGTVSSPVVRVSEGPVSPRGGEFKLAKDPVVDPANC